MKDIDELIQFIHPLASATKKLSESGEHNFVCSMCMVALCEIHDMAVEAGMEPAFMPKLVAWADQKKSAIREDMDLVNAAVLMASRSAPPPFLTEEEADSVRKACLLTKSCLDEQNRQTTHTDE